LFSEIPIAEKHIVIFSLYIFFILNMTFTHPSFDVVIVGAGFSGIASAWYLKNLCPWASYTILEGREAIGGIWDLF